MGLTGRSSGFRLLARARGGTTAPMPGGAPTAQRTVLLVGNPNVGKSTVFNSLTGMHQHTGNWPGKTVACAEGTIRVNGRPCVLKDLPGTYSLFAKSPEEEVTREAICASPGAVTVIVCDATLLARSCTLALQILELSARSVLCVNLVDEAERRHISLDLALLEKRLGVPVVGVVGRDKRTLAPLLKAIGRVMERPLPPPRPVPYPQAAEQALAPLVSAVSEHTPPLSARFIAARMLDGDEKFLSVLRENCGAELFSDPGVLAAREAAAAALAAAGYDPDGLRDAAVSTLYRESENVTAGVIKSASTTHGVGDNRLDRLFTGRKTAYPVMLLLLIFVFWLTIVGANRPSAWLSVGFAFLSGKLATLFVAVGMPPVWQSLLLDGLLGTLSSVVSVMLPPMAIFFPLFTLLEDSGYLPRVAYALDRPFRACAACGKQALTMCMGFGCNAAGVVGCRIIDSPRERRLAILTNGFVPCNGRFPALITLFTLFFAAGGGFFSTWATAGLLLLFVLLGVALTFLFTRLLSATILRGEPSSFTLELPPYRRPQVLRVLVRSLLDRTATVLGRAVLVAAPAGVVLWLLAHWQIGEGNCLSAIAGALDPVGRAFGLDGAILTAFLFGLPANEIVLPILLMIYTQGGVLSDVADLPSIAAILSQNGWTAATALCTAVFFLLHWPCSTTLITVYKETGRARDALLAAALPTAAGLLLCAAITGVSCLL